jgi:(p)ppGpp synthase/HD superfamily hydrolase
MTTTLEVQQIIGEPTEVARAERIARWAHAHQVEIYGGHPYPVHLERVVALLGDDDIDKAVGWLHDLFEDTAVTADDLRALAISSDVIDAVEVLTRGRESYTHYILRVRASSNARAIRVKIADLRDHVREGGPALPESLLARYRYALALLAEERA